jgi:DNA-binding beta-propeller fold protein YncE
VTSAPDGPLHYPTGVTADGDDLWIVDSGNFRIERLDPSGHLTSVAGINVGGFSDGDAAHATLAPMLGVARFGDAWLVADAGNDRLRVIEPGTTPATTTVRTFAGAWPPSSADGTGAAAGLVVPTGLFVDAAAGLVYVADSGNSLIRVIRP